MDLEKKKHTQGCIYDLLTNMADVTVGDIIDVGFGLVYMVLHQHHEGDNVKVKAAMEEVFANVVDQIPTIVPAQNVVLPGHKLDS